MSRTVSKPNIRRENGQWVISPKPKLTRCPTEIIQRYWAARTFCKQRNQKQDK